MTGFTSSNTFENSFIYSSKDEAKKIFQDNDDKSSSKLILYSQSSMVLLQFLLLAITTVYMFRFENLQKQQALKQTRVDSMNAQINLMQALITEKYSVLSSIELAQKRNVMQQQMDSMTERQAILKNKYDNIIDRLNFKDAEFYLEELKQIKDPYSSPFIQLIGLLNKNNYISKQIEDSLTIFISGKQAHPYLDVLLRCAILYFGTKNDLYFDNFLQILSSSTEYLLSENPKRMEYHLNSILNYFKWNQTEKTNIILSIYKSLIPITQLKGDTINAVSNRLSNYIDLLSNVTYLINSMDLAFIKGNYVIYINLIKINLEFYDQIYFNTRKVLLNLFILCPQVYLANYFESLYILSTEHIEGRKIPLWSGSMADIGEDINLDEKRKLIDKSLIEPNIPDSVNIEQLNWADVSSFGYMFKEIFYLNYEKLQIWLNTDHLIHSKNYVIQAIEESRF